jgi:hypothetical protein
MTTLAHLDRGGHDRDGVVFANLQKGGWRSRSGSAGRKSRGLLRRQIEAQRQSTYGARCADELSTGNMHGKRAGYVGLRGWYTALTSAARGGFLAQDWDHARVVGVAEALTVRAVQMAQEPAAAAAP